jgi:hypothetical protein
MASDKQAPAGDYKIAKVAVLLLLMVAAPWMKMTLQSLVMKGN